MKEIVLITGANGFVANRLAKILLPFYSVRFLTRHPKKADEYKWDLFHHYIDPKALEQVSHIIHLAGADISEKRWTSKRKQEIKSSRIDSAQLILESMKEQNIKIQSFITASAIGIYGNSSEQTPLNENALKGEGFLAGVVSEWEQVADDFLNLHVAERVVKVRTGVILSKEKGALPKMVRPILWGVGAPLGSGDQYISWIHIEDVCQIYKFLLDHKTLKGVFNAVAPENITNKEFTYLTAKLIKRYILFPFIPAPLIRIIFGEMAQVLMDNIPVSSRKIEGEGYSFQFKNLKSALENLLN